MEGTVAHALCAILLTELSQRRPFPNIEDAITELKKSDEFTPADVDTYYCPEMWDLCGDYAIFVFSEYQKELKSTPDAILEIETSIDISRYGDGMRGTTDSAIVSDLRLIIFEVSISSIVS